MFYSTFPSGLIQRERLNVSLLMCRPCSSSRSRYWSALREIAFNPNRPRPSDAQGYRSPRAQMLIQLHKYGLILIMRSLARINEKSLNAPVTRYIGNNLWRHYRERAQYSRFFLPIPPDQSGSFGASFCSVKRDLIANWGPVVMVTGHSLTGGEGWGGVGVMGNIGMPFLKA